MAVGVKFERVTKTFGDLRVVDGIDLTIEPGELFFLLGPSGCGKTTLLRCLAGFYTPEQGRILLGERDVTQLPPEARDTGMVFQSYALWPHLTVAENVAFGLELRKVAKPEIRRRVEEALARVKMTERAAYKPNQLSGGQQQRVALARALVIEPACILLDEPLSNLDAKLRLEMRTEIRRICKQAGLTAIYVTHDQKEALSIADRLAVLDRGVIQQLGTPQEVYRRPRSCFVANFIGETNFLDGTVREAGGGRTVVDTVLGPVATDALPPGGVRAGDKITLSVRPEALRLGASAPAGAANAFAGTLLESVYLGEMAQQEVELRGPGGAAQVKVLDPNPALVAHGQERAPVAVWFEPSDAVVLKE